MWSSTSPEGLTSGSVFSFSELISEICRLSLVGAVEMSDWISGLRVVGYCGPALVDCVLCQPLLFDPESKQFFAQTPESEQGIVASFYRATDVQEHHESGDVRLLSGSAHQLPEPPIPVVRGSVIILVTADFVESMRSEFPYERWHCIERNGQVRHVRYVTQADAEHLMDTWAKRYERLARRVLTRALTAVPQLSDDDESSWVDRLEKAMHYVRFGRYCAVREATRWSLLVLRGAILTQSNPADVDKLYSHIVCREFHGVTLHSFRNAVDSMIPDTLSVEPIKDTVSRSGAARHPRHSGCEQGFLMSHPEILKSGLPRDVQESQDMAAMQMQAIRRKNQSVHAEAPPADRTAGVST